MQLMQIVFIQPQKILLQAIFYFIHVHFVPANNIISLFAWCVLLLDSCPSAQIRRFWGETLNSASNVVKQKLFPESAAFLVHTSTSATQFPKDFWPSKIVNQIQVLNGQQLEWNVEIQPEKMSSLGPRPRAVAWPACWKPRPQSPKPYPKARTSESLVLCRKLYNKGCHCHLL